MLIRIFTFLIFILLFNKGAFCIDIGSDIAVNRFSTQQTLNNGDRVAGFSVLEKGFKLNGAATFDSFFSVSGNIELQGMALTLNTDLCFSDVSSIVTLGSIIGNNHSMIFSPEIKIIPEESEIGCGSLGCQIDFVTNVTQPDDIFSSNWSFDSQFIAVGLDAPSSGSRDVLRIYQFNGSSLVLKDSDSLDDKDVNSVSWSPLDYF